MSAVNLTEISDHILFHLGGHIGRDKAMKREDLLAALQADVPGLKDRTMRKAVEKCCPWVCSGACGYYFPADERDVLRAVRYLEKHIYGLSDRRRAILARYPDAAQMRIGEAI